MELRLHMPDDQIAGLQERTDTARAADLVRESIELMDWATQQVALGHQVYATDGSGNFYHHGNDALNRAQY